ncbi:DsbA family protein [Niabella pedocola]|uniref:DsbA family protein n=1 Tax=Niabella pedocola TaxID=1752077 RepID=A0ABS8PPX5_9BACT|nr:DsbA family protein [Niabella pedocola]MCD2421881.1 DsbA family protein [Niabella pedocola]
MKTIVIRVLAAVLMILAVVLSFYLFYKHLHAGGPDVCSAVFGNSCNGALSGPYAEVLGLPLGGWGILYYFVLGLFFLIPLLFGKAFLEGSRFFIFLFSCCSVGAGIYLMGVMLVHPGLFCPLCTIIHSINFLLFFLLIKINGYGFPQFFTSLRMRRGARQQAATAGFWKMFGFLVAGLFMASAFFGLKALALSVAAGQRVDLKKVLADYDRQPARQIPVGPGDASTGNPSGPMTLVIFTDFYCPACRMFAAETDSIVKKFSSTCRVVFKQFPLSTDCNPTIHKNMHAGACEAARAALAAAQQGRFMEYHRELFSSDSHEKKLASAAQQCGLNLPAFEAFRNSPAVTAILQANIAEGAALGIDGTPAVFLNGRQIRDTRPGVVRSVLVRELQSRQSSAVNK